MSSSRTNHYWFGLAFIALGIYYVVQRDYLEFSLYLCAGMTFIVNAFTMSPAAAPYRKPLVIITWLLIGVSGILFLYMLQFKYL